MNSSRAEYITTTLKYAPRGQTQQSYPKADLDCSEFNLFVKFENVHGRHRKAAECTDRFKFIKEYNRCFPVWFGEFRVLPPDQMNGNA